LLKAVMSFYLLTKGVTHVIQNLGCGRLARLSLCPSRNENFRSSARREGA
jgi:hypothetical protein